MAKTAGSKDFTPEEDRVIKAAVEAGVSLSAIAQVLHRSRQGVYKRVAGMRAKGELQENGK